MDAASEASRTREKVYRATVASIIILDRDALDAWISEWRTAIHEVYNDPESEDRETATAYEEVIDSLENFMFDEAVKWVGKIETRS